MKKNICKFSLAWVMCVAMLLQTSFGIQVKAAAKEETTSGDAVANESQMPFSEEEPRKYFSEFVNAGKNDGYNKSKAIGSKDLHYGWKLGKFFVRGYTRAETDEDGNPVFLKNVGDKIGLFFVLDQNIDELNGIPKMYIKNDKKTQDIYFQTAKQDFGRGTLIVRHTDYQGNVGDPVVYTDYLSAVEVGADTQIEFFEEGDYEVALDYCVERKSKLGFKKYADYRMFMKFSVRNGNCMVYPFDIGTGKELTDSEITPNGFKLDLARSRYLLIDIKKEVLPNGKKGLSEDVRFNKPAKDGDKYVEEGIYTFTVTNRYTKQTTTKQIYVGTDEVLMAYVATDYSIEQIKMLLAHGAKVQSDGSIVMPATYSEADLIEDLAVSVVVPENTHPVTEEQMVEGDYDSKEQSSDIEQMKIILFILCGIVVLLMFLVVFLFGRIQSKKESDKGRQDRDEIKTEPKAQADLESEE